MNPFKRFWRWAFGTGDFGYALLFTVGVVCVPTLLMTAFFYLLQAFR